MKKLALLTILTVFYLILLLPFTSYMRNKPIIEKMSYIPEPGILKLFAADQYHFVAESLVMTVISYFGGISEQAGNKVNIPPEYPAMKSALEAAVRLDPYNMDAYYFAQAIMVWDAGQVREITDLLEYGMKYRTWDFYLPFFAGFNYAYFLKDYEHAAVCYQRVGELTGSELTINLAGRYMYESGRTDLAISYLSMMAKSASNDAVRKTLQTRLQALQGVRKIEEAEEHYVKKYHRLPLSVEGLIAQGYLTEPPLDPYGGKYYIDSRGKVRTTSKLSFINPNKVKSSDRNPTEDK